MGQGFREPYSNYFLQRVIPDILNVSCEDACNEVWLVWQSDKNVDFRFSDAQNRFVTNSHLNQNNSTKFWSISITNLSFINN